VAVTYEVFVEWDQTDWSAAPAFTHPYHDISLDVQTVGWLRGKEVEAGNAPAATFEVRMKPGLCAKYSMFNVAGPLYGLLLPWRMIRVRATNTGGAPWYSIFFGFIAKYRIDPHINRQAVSFYCTDGLDVLARQTIEQDFDTRLAITGGEAVSLIADVAGWGARRNIDIDDGLLQYPTVGD
jgi:hypothetical protein